MADDDFSSAYYSADEATRRLARKRQLARMLQEQSFKGLQLANPNARASWANVASPLAQALIGGLTGRAADEEGKAQEKAQAEGWSQAAKVFQPHEDSGYLPGQLADQGVPDQAPTPPTPPPDQQPTNPMAQLLAGQPSGSLGAQMLADQTKPSAPSPADLKPPLLPGPALADTATPPTPLVPKSTAAMFGPQSEGGAVTPPMELPAFAEIPKTAAPAAEAEGAPSVAKAAAVTPPAGPPGTPDLTTMDKNYGLKPGTFNTFVALERGKPGQVNKDSGAAGPFQITPKNVDAYSAEVGRRLDPHDWQEGAYMASKVIKDSQRLYPDNEAAQVAYYNGGKKAGDAVAAGKEAPTAEGRDYVARWQAMQGGVPPMAAPGPTPAPSLAGPPQSGMLAQQPVLAEQGGGPTDEQWNATADSPSPTPYPSEVPPPTLVSSGAQPPPLVPQPPGAAVTPRSAQPPTPTMLPAAPMTIDSMLRFVDALPPGQMKTQAMQQAMKTIAGEPDREAQRDLTKALTLAKVGAQQQTAADKNASAERRAGIAAKARTDAASISAAARGTASTPSLSPEAIKQGAEQYLAGDKSVVSGLGYGGIGAANRAAMREGIVQLAKERNMSGADVAAKLAEFGGLQAAERTLGQRGAVIEMAVREASAMGDLLVKASENVPRTDFTPANQALNYWNTKTGDPAVRQFGASLNSFINVYARAVGGTTASSGSTVSDKEHAREMLNTADSHEQVVAILAQLQKEMETAKDAPKAVRASIRQEISAGDSGGAPATSGGGSAPAATAAPVSIDAERAEAKAAIASNPKNESAIRARFKQRTQQEL